MVTHPSVLAWKIQWTKMHGGHKELDKTEHERALDIINGKTQTIRHPLSAR